MRRRRLNAAPQSSLPPSRSRPWARVLGLLSLSAWGGPAIALAESSEVVELEEVVVSAPGGRSRLAEVPHGVSVITASDIRRSTALNLGELLAREAGLNLQSYTGTRSQLSIDIRGMGATAGSNVLVLVDGVRLNEDDLSGADLGSIALAQVERIEILRGGGAVRYGNQAVGGVIQIVTRSARNQTTSLRVEQTLGSNGTRSSRLQGSLGRETWALGWVAASEDSRGDRQNGGVQAWDGSVDLRWLPRHLAPLTDLRLQLSRHRSTAGLPGPVSREAFRSDSSAARYASSSPQDEFSLDDHRVSLSSELDFDHGGRLHGLLAWRGRHNPYLIGYDPGRPREDQSGKIETARRDWALRYELDLPQGRNTHGLALGVHGRKGDFMRRDFGLAVAGSTKRQLGAVEEGGVFADTRLQLGPQLRLQAGVRRDRFRSRRQQESYLRTCDFVTVSGLPLETNCRTGYEPTGAQGGNWVGRAAELGLSWSPTPDWTLFASHSRHFRQPNLDELALASADLRPQRGRTSEAGARWRRGVGLEAALTVFEIRNTDELFFDAAANLNRNYERPTERTGAEAELRTRPRPDLALRLNLAYVAPRFSGSADLIPLVPQTTANLELEWTPWTGTQALLSVRYVGARLDGNQTATQRFDRLDDYTVCDLAWRQTLGRVGPGELKVSAGVSNLFDQVYSTLAYSQTYYPMPGRQVFVSASWAY